MTKLEKQIAFILELDQLKAVLRQTTLTVAGNRQENSAEHSWHLAVMATLLAEYATDAVDVSRVAAMLLVHDVVEIDAGDTFAYDEAGYEDKEEREQKAAERLFGMLPEEQGKELRAAWDEFEKCATAEARYANALDRLQPLLLNSKSGGGSWRTHRVSREQVLRRMEPIRLWTPRLWPVVMEIVDDASARSWLA